MCASINRVLFTWWILIGVGVQLAVPASAKETGAPVEAGQDATPVVYFHTEFLPYQQTLEGPATHQLNREFIRQAFIASARHELGLPTRDETLGESIPESQQVVHLALLERASHDSKKWHVKLFAFDQEQQDRDPSGLWDSEPIWEETYDWGWVGVFNEMAPVFDKAAKNEFVTALKKAGLSRQARPESEPKPVPDEIEQRLRQVDFVDQFYVMRAAHEAIDAGGESIPWLEVLVRAYANLSMLTQHHWNAASEAFASRSFVYAQRLITASNESDRALWHRAYSWALCGVHHQALADMGTIEDRAASSDRASNSGSQQESAPPQLPVWTELIDRFCHCDRLQVRQFGKQHPEWKAWSARLRFFLTSTYRYPSWMFEEFQEIREILPKAYGIYAALACPRSDLGVKRTGAFSAPSVFAQGVTQSLAGVEGLPENVRQVVDESGAESAGDRFARGSFGMEDIFSEVPSHAAQELRKASRQETAGNASWSILAYLLEEEVFLEAAQFLTTALDGTERSLSGVVDRVLPLLEDHRYAKFIESYRYFPGTQWSQFSGTLRDIEIIDPSRSMYALMDRSWNVKDASGESIGKSAYWSTNRDHTVQGMVEYCFYADPTGADWMTNVKNFAKVLAQEINAISPHLELATRVSIGIARDPDMDQLESWETQIRDDAESYRLLARRYREKDRKDDAIRCYLASLGTRRTFETTNELARFYYRLGKRDKLEETYLTFIERTESQGLKHARAHNRLANHMNHFGEWDRSKPHAYAAAQSYSAWGLLQACRVTEALAEWEDSERFARSASEGYTSTIGYRWYLWCCRTGRGDKQAALRVAERYFSEDRPQRTRNQVVNVGAYQLLRGDTQAALKLYREALDFYTSYTCTYMVAQLARELGNKELRTQVLDQLDTHLDGREAAISGQEESGDEEETIAAGRAIAALIRDGNASEDRLRELETALSEVAAPTRSAFAYFVGTELAELGKQQEAEKYLRRAMLPPARDLIYGTLAGWRLAQENGTSRPDDDVLAEEDLWPQPSGERSP